MCFSGETLSLTDSDAKIRDKPTHSHHPKEKIHFVVEIDE